MKGWPELLLTVFWGLSIVINVNETIRGIRNDDAFLFYSGSMVAIIAVVMCRIYFRSYQKKRKNG